jgi:hypothetical protein
VNSAAAGWTIHSSNSATAVNTYWVNTTLPIGGKQKMIRIIARGNESGIWQPLTTTASAVMLSAWVFVRSGHIVMQASAGLTGPSAWSDKLNEWEELRICTDGTVPVDNIILYTEDPNGGDFFIDRVEARAIN